MEATEASTSTDSGNLNFHVFPWKLALTSMEVNLLVPTSNGVVNFHGGSKSTCSSTDFQ